MTGGYRRDQVMFPSEFEDRLYKLRIYTVTDLSKRTDLSPSVLYRWINTGRLTERTAKVLADLMKCKPTELGTIVRGQRERKSTRERKARKRQARYESTLKEQLCWTCKNAVPEEGHGCSWSRSYKPVEGVEYKEHARLDGSIGRRIVKCPEYIAEVVK